MTLPFSCANQLSVTVKSGAAIKCMKPSKSATRMLDCPAAVVEMLFVCVQILSSESTLTYRLTTQ